MHLHLATISVRSHFANVKLSWHSSDEKNPLPLLPLLLSSIMGTGSRGLMGLALLCSHDGTLICFPAQVKGGRLITLCGSQNIIQHNRIWFVCLYLFFTLSPPDIDAQQFHLLLISDAYLGIYPTLNSVKLKYY